ncbi:hypothetical protein BWI15_28550 [Kribbella sp. ALI-6-A]|nr:hypothetical protein BWI15_28550 [Kribbella sp. ALI-6-A]
MWIEETQAMSTFALSLKNPNLAVITANPMTACGGLPECGALAAGVNELFAKGLAFLTEADRGFTAFKDIVMQCHNDYQANDTTQTEKIAATEHHTAGEDWLPGLAGTASPAGDTGTEQDGMAGVLEPLLTAGNEGGNR